jgi:hypothetical protein
MTQQGSTVIKNWPEESREAAQLVIDTYGEPQEATESTLTWHDAGSWKRIVATRAFFQHEFPAPAHRLGGVGHRCTGGRPVEVRGCGHPIRRHAAERGKQRSDVDRGPRKR